MYRVCPGKCYHLYNGLRASLLDAYQLPEIMRTPLEELCLQIKVVRKKVGRKKKKDWQLERNNSDLVVRWAEDKMAVKELAECRGRKTYAVLLFGLMLNSLRLLANESKPQMF